MSRWFWSPVARPSAAMRLYCIAHAGAGGSTFATWGRVAPAWIDVVAVTLPGREVRLSEPLVRDMQRLATDLAADIVAQGDARPYCLFGHSLGARVAARTAFHLERARTPPAHLFVSASRGDRPVQPKLSGLPGPSFLAALNDRYGTLPAAITDNPAAWALYEPVLRADLALLEQDGDDPGRLDCPVTAYVGDRDGVAGAAEAITWQAWTRHALQVRHLDVDHFALRTHAAEYLRHIAIDTGHLPSPPVGTAGNFVQCPITAGGADIPNPSGR